METFTLFEASNELKSLLTLHLSDALKMREALDAYMMERHRVAPADLDYKDLLDLYKKRGGLRGYFDVMGL